MKKFIKGIAYSIIPFALFGLVLLISYFGNQLLTNNATPGSMHYGSPWAYTSLDDKIPLIPGFIYIYYLTFPVGILTFFYVAYKNKKSLYDIFLTLVISFLISGIIYFFFQTRFIKPDLNPTNFTEQLVLWTWNSTNPTNCFPSQHCFMAIAIFIGCTDCKGLNIFYRIFGWAVAILIVLSTVFTKQHFWVDFLASFAIMVPTFFAIKFSKLGTKCQNAFDKFYTKLLNKFKKDKQNTEEEQ